MTTGARSPMPDLGDSLLALFEQVSAVVWVYDLDERALVFVNQAYEQVWGRPVSELFERPGSWMDAVHEEDLERVRGALRGLREGGYDVEYRLRRADGSLRHVHARAFSVSDDPRGRQRVMGIVQDVTDQLRMQEAQQTLLRTNEQLEALVGRHSSELAEASRRIETSEERYRLFVERSPVGIWCLEMPQPLDPDLPLEEQCARIAAEARVIECNDVVARRLGLASAADLRGTPVGEAPTLWGEENQTALLEVVTRRYRLTDAPRCVPLPGGGVRHLRTDVVGVFEEGGLRRLWCTERDVTARVLAEERATDHQSRLVHFSRLNTLGEMAAGIAHELNQPLAAIVNYARGCTRRLGEEVDPEVHDALNAIAEQSERAGASLRRLRGFTRIDPQPRVNCSARAIVGEAVQLLAHRQRASGAELELDLGEADDTVQVDAIQVEQVVLQLLRNAYDALEESGAADRRITVRLRPTPTGIELSVRDRGPGLAPSAAERAFDPFFSGREGGVGLGLTVSRSVVEAHGGRLWHVAPADGGAAFHFTLLGPSVKMEP